MQKLLVSFGILHCAALALHAQVLWNPISYQDLIADSDLVVTGKLSSVAHWAHDEGTTECATLDVIQVLWGTAPIDKIHLDFPSRKAQSPESASGPVPTDVYYEDGQEGVWFLQKDAQDGHYRAPHPARFKPLALLGECATAITTYKVSPRHSGT